MILTGEHNEAFHLFTTNPAALKDQLTASMASCLGHVFIFRLMSSRGPIVVSLTTTTRKIFTVLLTAQSSSAKLYGKQGLGIGIVLVGIMLECLVSVLKKKETKPQSLPSEEFEDKKDKKE